MTMRMFVTTTAPRRIALILMCDGIGSLLLCTAMAEFDVTGGIPRDVAIKAGWKFDPNGPVLCPNCKGVRT